MRTTIRVLESLLRISEAHAKLMFRNRVEIVDAIVSIICVSSSVAHWLSVPFGQHSPTSFHNMISAENFVEQEKAIFESLHFTPSEIQHLKFPKR